MFPCNIFQVLFHLLCMYLSHFLGMSKVDPHASKKQKKCGTCHSFLSELDPHPECNKCLPRGCCKESPCSHCAPLSLDAWKKWERQQCSKRSSSTTKGPKGESAKVGNKSGKVCPEVPSTPKAVSPGRLRLAALESGFSSFKTEIASMFANLTGRLTVSHPPDSNADGSRLQGGVARGGVIPSRELEDPLASQWHLTVPLDPTAMPLVEPSRVAGPSGSTSHTATAMDPVHGSQWSDSSIDITLTALTSSYGSNSMGEVSTGTASTRPAYGRHTTAFHSG